jgi:MFS family permease
MCYISEAAQFFSTAMNLAKLSTFCGIFYFHGAPLSRFLTSLQVHLGFSSTAIGNILGFIRIATSFLSPTISSVADSRKIHRLLMISQILLRLVPAMVLWSMYRSDSLTIWSYFSLNALMSMVTSGNGPLSDSLLLASLDDKSQYGKVRLWGALTYGLGNLILGVAIQAVGDFNPMFLMALLTVWPAVGVAYWILPPFASETKPTIRLTPSSVAHLLTHSAAMKVFVINSIIIGAALSLVESLLFVAMERTMNESTPILAGASVFISVLFELPIFQVAPKLIERLGTKKMLIIANIAWIIRALGYAIFSSAWVVLILEMLHGVTFGLFFSAAVHVCVKQAPPGLESTMQSLLDMNFSGLGVALGTIGGGFLFDSIGTSETFLLFCFFVCVSTIAVWFLFEEPQAPSWLDPVLSQEMATLESVDIQPYQEMRETVTNN